MEAYLIHLTYLGTMIFLKINLSVIFSECIHENKSVDFKRNKISKCYSHSWLRKKIRSY